MGTAAEEIDKAAARAAFAAGMAHFAGAFGRTLAAMLVGVAVGLLLAWALWLLWFASWAGAVVLVAPGVCFGFGVAAAVVTWAATKVVNY